MRMVVLVVKKIAKPWISTSVGVIYLKNKNLNTYKTSSIQTARETLDTCDDMKNLIVFDI